MCGILGSLPAANADKFLEALNTLSHRGPDGYGVWHDSQQRISLGHRRLAIIDLSDKGRQPMEWGGRYVITFNGEIYNYVELRKELEGKGIKFETRSDTEVLLALFATEGPRAVTKLNGMWAFAIYDKLEGTLFLSRDRLGKKPLFYIHDGNTLVFASEMKALYPFLARVEPDEGLVRQATLNVFSYESGDRCLIKGIKRLPAATNGMFAPGGGLKLEKYWDALASRIEVPRKYEDQVDMFRDLFIDACKIRMRSDVPVGTALSGGIDSSSTISTMAYVAKNVAGEYSRDWQHAFVASFPGSAIDESAEAKMVVDQLGIEATFLAIDPVKDIDKLTYYSYLFEELYLTPPIPFIQLYGQIKSANTTVTLDGHGGDELFGGYAFDIGAKLQDDYPNPFSMRQTLQTVADCREEGTVGWPNVYRQFRTITRQKMTNSRSDRSGAGSLDHLNAHLYKSTFETILPTLLRNYDRYSMINGVEIRMPFLDHRIVSFAFSIPAESKVRNGYTKAIVRDAMKGFFPDHVRLLKRKTGFNSPVTEWIRGPLKDWARDIIHSRDFEQARFIDPNLVRKKVLALMDSQAPTFADGENVWLALMPYFWERSLQFARNANTLHVQTN